MATKTDDAGGADFIEPLTISRKIDGRTVTISPLVVSELPAFLALIVPLLAAVPGFGPDWFKRLGADDLPVEQLVAMLTSLSVNGGTMIEIIVLCTRSHEQPASAEGQPPTTISGEAHAEWIRTRLPDRAIWLAGACIAVNVDFFARAMPQIRALASLRGARPGS